MQVFSMPRGGVQIMGSVVEQVPDRLTAKHRKAAMAYEGERSAGLHKEPTFPIWETVHY